MRFLSSLGLTAELVGLIQLWPVLTPLIPRTNAINFTPVPLPELDIRELGRVILTGDFDAISLYTYQQQTEDAFSTNGTQSLIAQLPNGDFANAANADGYIKTMCPFVTRDMKLQGVIVGGNFTSLGGVPAQGVALYDPSKSQVTPLPGLTGIVNALYCDQETETVYVGGQFKGANSTNAIIWVGQQGWVNLPFEGFNGPVNSIVKGTNGSVVFGGSFTSLGNRTAPAKSDTQVINLSSANYSSAATASTDGFNKESNIVCKTSGQGGAGSTWLLQDNTPGWWRADMNFGYEPSLLRVYNTHYQGRGTKTFRFTAIPINGIMNFTYTDPDTGAEGQLCDARCPLSSNPSVPYQDFRFVNTVGMSAFRIDISDWHGAGGGLNGIELFQNDTFAYAENDLNEPQCAASDSPSRSTQTGPWNVMPSAQSVSRYLAANLPGGQVNPQDVAVTFQPDIKQVGNYTVTIFTPGCIQDNSCDKRGIVNVTGTFSTSTGAEKPVSTQIYQTNSYDKYDVIYRGPVDVSSGAFRPSVTIQPRDSETGSIMLVAQRVQFQTLGNGTSSMLNGLYEFDPRATNKDLESSNSTIDTAGANLNTGAIVNSIAVQGNSLFVAGNFSDQKAGFRNIFSVGDGNASALANGGLNDQVSSLLVYEEVLYMGGNFTDTVNSSTPGLSNVAAYIPSTREWQALGAGVDGSVDTVVGFTINISSTPELVIAFNGHFNEIKASGSSKAVPVQGFAVWVPSRKNWLRNLSLPSQAVSGKLSAMTNVTGGSPLLAGTLAAQDLLASDAVSLRPDPLRLNALDLGMQPQAAGPRTRKRALSTQDLSGITTGLFYSENTSNITILGGHFTATASDGSAIDNLAIVNNGGAKPGITGLAAGLDRDSIFLALDTSGTNLYAGGSVTGKIDNGDVNGLVVYDLAGGKYASPQPPALGGQNVVVNAVTVPPKKQQVFVGGSFETAGSLSCPAVCVYDGAWSQPGSGLAGTVNAFTWQGNNKLLVGGNLTVSNNATSLANYDLQNSQWTALDGAAASVPGPVTALTQADGQDSHFWLAGRASNNSAFLMKYDGSKFRSVGDVLGPGSTIYGLSMYNLKRAHGASTDLISNSHTLMVLGELILPNFGNASAALFNGTVFTPYALTNSGNGPGRLSQLFTERQVKFTNPGGHMAVGFVVLIALACALGAVFLLVVAGILIERYRRKREGYNPAPTAYFDKTSNMGRIPPEHLFGRLGENREPPML